MVIRLRSQSLDCFPEATTTMNLQDAATDLLHWEAIERMKIEQNGYEQKIRRMKKTGSKMER